MVKLRLSKLAVTRVVRDVSVQTRSKPDAPLPGTVRGMSDNPAIRQQPNGDVDIAVPDDEAREVQQNPEQTAPEASTNPENLDHPEELMGE
jgi:hypothetical protein